MLGLALGVSFSVIQGRFRNSRAAYLKIPFNPPLSHPGGAFNYDEPRAEFCQVLQESLQRLGIRQVVEENENFHYNQPSSLPEGSNCPTSQQCLSIQHQPHLQHPEERSQILFPSPLPTPPNLHHQMYHRSQVLPTQPLSHHDSRARCITNEPSHSDPLHLCHLLDGVAMHEHSNCWKYEAIDGVDERADPSMWNTLAACTSSDETNSYVNTRDINYVPPIQCGHFMAFLNSDRLSYEGFINEHAQLL